MRNLVNEAFPDFDDSLPEIEGFEDDSWKNDSSPSMVDETRRMKLYIDYKDPANSEHEEFRRSGDFTRYNLQSMDEDGEYLGDICRSDSLDEILEAIAEHRRSLQQEKVNAGPRLT